MESPSLIVEIPNAGRRGHRFLVSDGATIGDATVSAFISRGRSHAQTLGGNYIAVRHKVTQRTTGRPDADETLVLVGVDTSRLEANEQAKLIGTLQTLLPGIDIAVQKIDWNMEKRLVVPHKALTEWISEDIRSLPGADITGGPREAGIHSATGSPVAPATTAWTRPHIWIIAVALILVGATAIAYITGILSFGLETDTSAPGTGPEVGKGKGESPHLAGSDSVTSRIEQLTNELKSWAKDLKLLDALKVRLHELDREKELTKVEMHQLDYLRRELASKGQEIEDELLRNRQENSLFF